MSWKTYIKRALRDLGVSVIGWAFGACLASVAIQQWRIALAGFIGVLFGIILVWVGYPGKEYI
jgi:hypothetical protein